VRASLVQLAAEGRLEVPMARTYRLQQAMEAVELVRGRHPGGKVALVPAPTGTSESTAVTPLTG